MRKVHFKVCWYCGSRNLEPYLTGVKYKDCGATHNELPTLDKVGKGVYPKSLQPVED